MNALPEIKNPLSSARVVGENVSYEEYSHQLVERGHADYHIGRSDLADIRLCPHKWRMGYVNEDTAASDWGCLFEAMVQNPKTAGERFAVPPDTYPDEKWECPRCHSRTDSKSCAKCKVDRIFKVADEPWSPNAKYCRDWKDAQEKAGKSVLKPETWTQCENAVKFFFGHADLRDYVRCSKFQVMLEGAYEDSDTDLIIPLKGLVDLVPAADHPAYGKTLGDLKTTTNGSPFIWGREIQKRALHWQAALYLDLWTKATGEDRIEFRHLISESGPPWECTAYALTADYITLGRMAYIEAMKDYAQCLKTGHWPGYLSDPNVQVINGWGYIGPEPWMVNR